MNVRYNMKFIFQEYLKKCFPKLLYVDHVKDEINRGIDGNHEMSNIDEIFYMNIRTAKTRLSCCWEYCTI